MEKSLTVRRRRARPAVKLIGAVLIACLAAGAAGVWLGSRVKSPSQIAAATAPPPASTITVTLDERVLVDRLRAVGNVRSGKEVAVSVLAPESLPIVTREVVHVGDIIEAGFLLGEIAGRPVFVIAGNTPVYRTISPGDTGPDVEQLQQNLTDLGMLDGVTGVFDVGTQAAVGKLYESHGYDPLVANTDLASANDSYRLAQTAVSDAKKALEAAGEVSTLAVTQAEADLRSAKTDLSTVRTNTALTIKEAQARAVAAQAARDELADLEGVTAEEVRTADFAVLETNNGIVRAQADGDAIVEAATGRVRVAEQAATDARTAPNTAGESAALAAARDAFKREKAALAKVVEKSGVIVPASELVTAPEFPARLSSSTFTLGSRVSDEAWTVTSGERIVETYISAAQRTLVSSGDEATFTLDSQEIQGTIHLIDATLTTAPNGAEGHRVEIRTPTPLPATAIDTEVTLTITAVISEGEVLVAPVEAVNLNSDGQPIVTELVGETQLVHPVILGLSASGYVEILAPDSDPELLSGAVLLVEVH